MARKTTNIRKSKNGKGFQAHIKVYDRTEQKWRQVTKTFDIKRDAEIWIARTKVAYNGSMVDGGNLTVAEYFDAWADEVSVNWQGSTHRLNANYIERFVKRFGDMKLSRLTTHELDRWVREMRSDGVGAYSLHRSVQLVRTALKQAVRRKYIHENPTDSLSLPKLPKSDIVPPTQEELEKLLDECQHDSQWWGLFVRLAAVTGARRGELLALEWADFDLDDAVLTINKSMGRDFSNVEYVKSTKTGNTRRISLDSTTVDLFREYRASRFAGGSNPTTPIFVNKHGLVWPGSTIGYKWKKAREAVGLPDVRFHDLRHYHATMLLSSGASIPSVAGRLGHAGGGRTTIAVYGHWTLQEDRRMAEIVGNRFNTA